MTPRSANTTSQTQTLVLASGLAVSLALHLIVGSVVVLSARANTVAQGAGELAIELQEQREDPEIELGIEESKTASIAWLGVEEREQEGIAEASTVEQAALSTNPGEAEISTEPAPAAAAAVPVEAAREAVQTDTPTDDPVERELAEQTPPALEFAKDPNPDFVVVEPTTDVEGSDPEESEGDRAIEPVSVEASKLPPPEVLTVAPQSDKSVEPTTEPAPKSESTSESEAVPVTAPGLPGELARREAVATAIRTAEDVNYEDMHRPLSAHGLELNTKRPQYPVSVRNSALPRNAIVLIRFGRDGKVRSADFLVSADGKRRYDTGQLEIDGPLIAAIYQWTAKGERLKELDPDDKDATIEISMRILFNKPRYDKE